MLRALRLQAQGSLMPSGTSQRSVFRLDTDRKVPDVRLRIRSDAINLQAYGMAGPALQTVLET